MREGITRALKDLLRGAFFDHTTVLHDHDPIAYHTHRREIVRDKNDRQTPLTLQIAQQREDSGLRRDVERRDRFVADEHIGVRGERPRDGNSLPLAARQGDRPAVSERRIEAHEPEKVGG